MAGITLVEQARSITTSASRLSSTKSFTVVEVWQGGECQNQLRMKLELGGHQQKRRSLHCSSGLEDKNFSFLR